MRRTSKKETRARRLIERELAEGHSTARQETKSNHYATRHETVAGTRKNRNPSSNNGRRKESAPILGRLLLLESPDPSTANHMFHRRPFLYVASKQEVAELVFDMGDTELLKASVDKIVKEERIPLEAYLIFKSFFAPPAGKSFLIGELTRDSTKRNLEWMNTMRERLLLDPHPPQRLLQVPLFVLQRDPRDASTLEPYADSPINLGPITTDIHG